MISMAVKHLVVTVLNDNTEDVRVTGRSCGPHEVHEIASHQRKSHVMNISSHEITLLQVTCNNM